MQQKILNNRYELDRKIGEGGMARVYLGRDLRLNRRVAVKVPHSQYSSDQDFISRFEHEARAAAALSHPNIVDVFDVGQDGDIHYFVMEYIEGTDLKKLINRSGPLPVLQAAAIAEQAALGLHAAHQAGMVHRDVKPQNLIVADDGHVTITDFGVAKSTMSTAQTETGVVFGTADYISPEQAQGRPASHLSDIYSLGVTLYEMLTGRLPFTGDSSVAVAMKHLTENPTPPRQLNPQIPPQLESLVLRTLAKEPAQRPASAAELARLLRGLNVAAQQTMVNPSVPPPPPPGPPRPATSSTARTNIPPPRPNIAQPPRQEGLGCGVFLVGLLVIGAILGAFALFATGALDNLFTAGPSRPSSPTAAVDEPSPTPGETTTPTPTSQPTVGVPDLGGLTDSAAQVLLRQSQLVPVSQTAFNNDVPAGLVASQELAPGSQILPGALVTYTVSLGPNLVTLDNYAGRRVEGARQELERLGLVVEVRQQSSREITEGFVIGQSPNPGARLAAGDGVVLVVSIGDRVRFPDIIGLPRDQAEQIIRSTEGLSLVFVDEQGPDRLPNYESYFPGQVVSAAIATSGQGLNNGDLVPRGSEIVLGVRGP